MTADEPITRAILDEVLSNAFAKFAQTFGAEIRELISGSVAGLEHRMNARFEAVDKRFDAMDRRFDAADERAGRIENRLAHIESDIATIKDRLRAIEGEIKAQRNDTKYVLNGLAKANHHIAQLEAKFDKYYLLTSQERLVISDKVAQLKTWVLAANHALGLGVSVDS
ncbi:MAG TPA: hypothetical protein VNX65_05120 [Patescibacteria group bacterium]|jgi:chromosome segregation ATPase|nr:hypothetical protein [Patescibacteria group bacterium]